jgi:hypothetical protein
MKDEAIRKDRRAEFIGLRLKRLRFMRSISFPSLAGQVVECSCVMAGNMQHLRKPMQTGAQSCSLRLKGSFKYVSEISEDSQLRLSMI